MDVRVIAAKNRNLEKEVAKGRFPPGSLLPPECFSCRITPLRQRTKDIPALAQHYITHYNQKSKRKLRDYLRQYLKA
jgi:DNA-binding NtrC family response regulator